MIRSERDELMDITAPQTQVEGEDVATLSHERAVTTPEVSLIIPTHDRRERLRMVLAALEHQTVAAELYEVLIICDHCSDETAEMCRAFAAEYRLRVFEQAPDLRGPAAARNLGVREAAAAIILFIDDDVVPEATLIAEHLRTHREDERAVVIGPLLAPPDFRMQPWTRWEAETLAKQYRDMTDGKWEPTPRQFYTGNASVRREYILAAGGFDASFGRAEDVELAYRFRDQQLTFHFSPAAKGWHHARRPLRSWLNIATAYGEADVIMYRNGRRMTLDSMAKEFHWRHRAIQRVARLAVGRPYLSGPLVALLLTIAFLANLLRRARVAGACYSAIFNLRYYSRVSHELGGRRAFWKLVDGARPAPAAEAPQPA
ncbi:MAG TPA: glycosyltransferase [Ktedonobacterales bacterium]|nr:glycosyltransferase [Ktedonobacterales bacterium]